MSKRITIVLDDNIHQKLVEIQARTIQKKNSSYSFSRAINDTLKKPLKL